MGRIKTQVLLLSCRRNGMFRWIATSMAEARLQSIRTLPNNPDADNDTTNAKFLFPTSYALPPQFENLGLKSSLPYLSRVLTCLETLPSLSFWNSTFFPWLEFWTRHEFYCLNVMLWIFSTNEKLRQLATDQKCSWKKFLSFGVDNDTWPASRH